MIRLRFVEEHRGRRIVTNGELFGIQGDLVTDCRYLSVAGARVAIDSEEALTLSQKRREVSRADFAEYMAGAGKNSTFGCGCGWRGGYDKLKKIGADVLAMRCPTCASDRILVDLRGSPGAAP